ncbi:MAG: M48 family metalloprotease [Rivularia sp. T60_A2020_040]|nr:M48 family metalloprotease [Rivularia sp. T60_A2020_040]
MSSHSKSSLEAGLAALKQEDYRTAKIILEDVAARDSDIHRSLQAQVALVVAYSKDGEIQMAIAVCESLTQSNNSQIKEWAEKSLKKLRKKYPQQQLYSTGFVAFESSEAELDRVEQVEELISCSTPPPPPPSFSSSQAIKELPVETQTEAESDQKIAVEQVAHKEPNIHWRLGKRAKVWQPLPKINFLPLRLLGIGTFIALFWVARGLIQLAMKFINDILVALPFLEPLQFLYKNPTLFLLGIFTILTAVSPWLIDWLLCRFYAKKPLSRETLNTYSRESVRVLQRYCQPRGWKLPQLGILPIVAPIAFTFGHLPRTARIVVSQGLLEQLADDEIAAIVACQLGQIARIDCAVMPVMLLVTIPVYQLYQWICQQADNISNRIGRTIIGIIGNGVYGIWLLLTGTGLWLSQKRIYQNDRIGAEVTGNPNGLIRALLKSAIGIANNIANSEQTPWQLETLNLLIPVGYKQSLSLGSIAANTTFESLLMWDCLNPYRQWFLINNSHPLMGERLRELCKIAEYWHVEPELYLESQQSLKLKPESFLLQISPFLGILFGAASALLFRLAWYAAFAVHLINLKWIYDDWKFVTGFMLIGFSLGSLIRINSLFVDIKPENVQTSESLPELFTNPATLPIDSTAVEFSGKLLGRRGSRNYLGQDLILQVGLNLVKLHHVSWLGQSLNAQDFIGRRVCVTGWLRRGATPWLDIQTLKTQSGKMVNSPHPIWSTILTVATFAWGAYIILTS